MKSLQIQWKHWAILLPGERWYRGVGPVSKFDGGEELLTFDSVDRAEGKLRELRGAASDLGLSDAFAAAKVVALQVVTIAVPVLDEPSTPVDPFAPSKGEF